jgi:hypothetical protein
MINFLRQLFFNFDSLCLLFIAVNLSGLLDLISDSFYIIIHILLAIIIIIKIFKKVRLLFFKNAKLTFDFVNVVGSLAMLSISFSFIYFIDVNNYLKTTITLSAYTLIIINNILVLLLKR